MQASAHVRAAPEESLRKDAWRDRRATQGGGRALQTKVPAFKARLQDRFAGYLPQYKYRMSKFWYDIIWAQLAAICLTIAGPSMNSENACTIGQSKFTAVPETQTPALEGSFDAKRERGGRRDLPSRL